VLLLLVTNAWCKQQRGFGDDDYVLLGYERSNFSQSGLIHFAEDSSGEEDEQLWWKRESVEGDGK
jgi:hypothetical protein